MPASAWPPRIVTGGRPPVVSMTAPICRSGVAARSMGRLVSDGSPISDTQRALYREDRIARELAGSLKLGSSSPVVITSMTGRDTVNTVLVPALSIKSIGEQHTIVAPALEARNLDV